MNKRDYYRDTEQADVSNRHEKQVTAIARSRGISRKKFMACSFWFFAAALCISGLSAILR